MWTSDDLFPLNGTIPSSITFVGGGYIACELANFFSACGVKAKMLVRGDGLLDREDRDIAQVFKEQFTRHVDVAFGTSIASMTHDGQGFSMQLDGPAGSSSEHRTDAVVFAIGRIPNTDDLGLENTAVEKDQHGNIVTDDYPRSTVPGVYAIGDVAGKYVFQHVASYDVHYLRRQFFKGETGPVDYVAVPHAVFSDPEVAGVGLTEQVVEEQGTPFVSVFQDWLASARAMSMRLEYPRIKLLVSPEDYRILGCHLVGPESATILHEVLPVLRLKNDVRKLAEMMHVHPALPEVILSAAVKAVSEVREKS